MDKPENYYAARRNEIAELVPGDTRTIIDVGCGSGNFLKYIKEITGAETWGIEIVPDVAEEAGKVSDKVICSKIEDAIPLLPDNYFDCITFNDVIEHLEDPDQVLKLIRSKLTDRGLLIASIPNVRYLDNLIKLIVFKDWRYTSDGILDFTHLRFFTRKSMRRFFDTTGYKLVSQKGINGIRTWKFRICDILTFGFFHDTKFQQYVCVAKK